MKRILALLLAIVVVLSFAACGKTAEETKTNDIIPASLPMTPDLLFADGSRPPLTAENCQISRSMA